MTVTNYDFEGGTANAALTTAATGAILVNGGTFTPDAMHGSLAANFTGNHVCRWAFDSATKMAFRIYVKFDATPSGILTFATLQYSGGATLGLAFTTSNQVCMSAAAVLIPPTGTSYVGISQSTWYRIEVLVDLDAVTAEMHVYEGDSTAEVGSTSGSAFTVKGTPLLNADTGIVNQVTGDVTIDDVAVNPGGTTLIGPVAATPTEDGEYLYTGGQWVRVTVAS